MFKSTHKALLSALMTVALGLAPGALSGQTTQSASDIAENMRNDIEIANISGDIAGLDAARVMLERALIAHPNDPALTHYLGYTHYRIASASMDSDDDLEGHHLAVAQ